MRDKGGNAADAAIAAMLCVGIKNPHSAGIGGGHISVVYNAKRNSVSVINAREKAPINIPEKLKQKWKSEDDTKQFIGGQFIAVPGEIKGLQQLFTTFGSGKVSWPELFEDAIDLARNGFNVDEPLAIAIEKNKNEICGDAGLREVFAKDCVTGKFYKRGDTLKMPELADTLGLIAQYGGDEFYTRNARIAEAVAKDLEYENKILRALYGKSGSTIIDEDLWGYTAPVEEPISVDIGEHTIFTPKPPANGAVGSLILNILKGYDFDETSIQGSEKVLTYHRIVEAFKFGCAQGALLGDPSGTGGVEKEIKRLLSESTANSLRDKIRSDSGLSINQYGGDPRGCEVYAKGGTTHISIIDEDGNAVSMTSSINQYFGARYLGRNTGIIYNNHMADFRHHTELANSYNTIHPGKRPMSSMCPTIMVHKGERRVALVTGAAGADKITTSTTLVIMHSLWFNKNVIQSVERKRIHYDGIKPSGYPNGTVMVENESGLFSSGLYKDLKHGFKQRGHHLIQLAKNESLAVVQLVTQDSAGLKYAFSDNRKQGGAPKGYN